MPEIGRLWPTLLDVAKRLNPDGSVASVAELLNQTNPMVQDAPYLEGNLPTGHRSTMRTGLPASTFRLMYQGVQPSKSTTVQQTDSAGEILQYAEVDKSVADLNGNTAAFRLSEDRPQIEAMNQNIARASIYGNTSVTPQEFFGLAPRFNSLSAPNARNIVDAGGTGSNNTSIWMIVWSPETCHLFYPKGSTAGLDVTDKGIETITDPNGGRFEAYRTVYKWQGGLVLRDWRYVVRIANIDVPALSAAGQASYAGANLIKFLVDAYNRIENMAYGTPVIYANRTVISALDNIAQSKQNLALGMMEWAGAPVLSFRGIPIRMNDQILNTEQRVV